MRKEACNIYLNQAIASLEKMRSAVNDLPPDAAISFLEAAQEVAEMFGKSVGEGLCEIAEKKLRHDYPRRP